MASPSFIFDATSENYAELVQQNSVRGPVLVNYWAPWAGPCLKLWPALEKLAGEYRGRFLLVNVNTDKCKALARENGITSLPTLKMIRHGKVVDQVYGAESEASLRRLIERQLAPTLSPEHTAALRTLQRGDVSAALAQFAALVQRDPPDTRALIDYAKLLLQSGNDAEAERALKSLPHAEQDQGEVVTLLAHIGFRRVSLDAPPLAEIAARLEHAPDDLLARHRTAALSLFQDDFANALAQLLELVRRDRHYADDAGRRGMLAVFHILGENHPLSRDYAARLREVLY